MGINSGFKGLNKTNSILEVFASLATVSCGLFCFTGFKINPKAARSSFSMDVYSCIGLQFTVFANVRICDLVSCYTHSGVTLQRISGKINKSII